MKRFIFVLAVISFLLPVNLMGQGATAYNINRPPTTDWWSGNSLDLAWRWAKSIDRLVAGGMGASNIGTGNIYYVDSNVSNEGDGSSWTNAKDTLDEAINLCTADNGDLIYVAAGHTESGEAADLWDADVAGITIIGCGNGPDEPNFVFADTDTTVAIGAAGVTIENLTFTAGKSAVVCGISVEAAGDNFTMRNCTFNNPETSTFEFYDMVKLATGADYCTIVGNRFLSTVTDAGCNQAIDVDTGIVDRLIIAGNEFQGAFAVAAIHSNKVNTNCLIAGNLVHQATSGQFAIEFSAASTGLCIDNLMYTNAYATCLDPGSLACIGNRMINTTDLSEYVIPPAPAIGTVTAGSAEDILKKLYYVADGGTHAYPDTVVNESALAYIMSKSATANVTSYDNQTDSLEAISDAIGALGVADVGSYADEVVTHMDANSTSIAAIKAVTDTLTFNNIEDNVQAAIDANSTSIAAIKAVTDDLAGISQIGDKVQADMDANSALYWQPRTTVVSVDEVDADIMDIQGGPIFITKMTGIVTAEIGGNATTGSIMIDRDDTAADTYLTTKVNIESDAVGTVYVFTDAAQSVWTPLTPGDNGSTNSMGGWFVPEGMLEQDMSDDPGGAASDHITWYITWYPLASGVTCVGQ